MIRQYSGETLQMLWRDLYGSGKHTKLYVFCLSQYTVSKVKQFENANRANLQT